MGWRTAEPVALLHPRLTGSRAPGRGWARGRVVGRPGKAKQTRDTFPKRGRARAPGYSHDGIHVLCQPGGRAAQDLTRGQRLALWDADLVVRAQLLRGSLRGDTAGLRPGGGAGDAGRERGSRESPGLGQGRLMPVPGDKLYGVWRRSVMPHGPATRRCGARQAQAWAREEQPPGARPHGAGSSALAAAARELSCRLARDTWCEGARASAMPQPAQPTHQLKYKSKRLTLQ